MKLHKKYISLFIVFFILAFWSVSGCSKKAYKVYHVGILSGLNYFTNTAAGFKEKMAELGYIENKNIIYDYQKTGFDIVSYRSILKKFVEEKVDLIFVFPTEASMEAKAFQRNNIPVLFANASIEDTGLINSIREPGHNITGVRWPGPDMAVNIFEIMHELMPQAKRMLLPYLKGYPNINSQLKVLYPATAAAHITLIEAPVSNTVELQKLLDERAKLKDIGIDAILNIPEPLSGTPEAFLVMCKFAYEHRLPIGGTLNSIKGYESVFGVNVNHRRVGQQAAVLADKILKGTSAGTIRVISAESYLQINYRSAEKSGLKIREGLLNRADEVIR